jgi:hypothetical protein
MTTHRTSQRRTPAGSLVPAAALLLTGLVVPQPAAPHDTPHAAPGGVVLHAVLERTIFKVDVVALELWLGPATLGLGLAASGPLAPGDDPAAVVRDDLARVVADSREARAVMVFQRNVSLQRFLAGVMQDMRRARDAGLVSAAGYDAVSAGLPVWLAPLAEQGLRRGDRFRQTVVGDTLRTVVQRHGGAIVVDQTDVGAAHRRALLGSFVAPGSGLRDQLLDGLLTVLQATAVGP